jgi:hypothetical protein
MHLDSHLSAYVRDHRREHVIKRISWHEYMVFMINRHSDLVDHIIGNFT